MNIHDPVVRPAHNPVELRIGALDGLRGIAIGLVLLVHFGFISIDFTSRSWWLPYAHQFEAGWCGVDLFFVLSGFLIGGILLDKRNSPRLARVFYARRALRIMPLYYLLLAVIFLRLAHVSQTFSFSVYPLFLSNLAYAMTNQWNWPPLNVTWSLAVEEQFYLFAPWFVRAISPRKLPWILLSLWLGSLVLRFAMSLTTREPGLIFYTCTPFRLDGLALGWLAAWLVRTPEGHPIRAWFCRWWHWLLGLSFIFALGFLAQDSRQVSFAAIRYGYALLAVFFATLTLTVVLVHPPWLAGPLNNRWLCHLGRHSYFIYLWHELVAYVAHRYILPDFPASTWQEWAAMCGLVGIVWIMAIISRHIFEGPLIRLGHRLAY
ncbi:MAG TPA: acyltransferase [Opitutaceae bacterium]|jgi:peptidoglycan/LPS O-acetylase OafA/YrhL|nr:acyltransferase [Opitutaceae bacterium]